MTGLYGCRTVKGSWHQRYHVNGNLAPSGNTDRRNRFNTVRYVEALPVYEKCEFPRKGLALGSKGSCFS